MTGRATSWSPPTAGVFTFGDAHFSGSLAGQTLPAPIVGMKKGGFAPGYYLADANGNVYNVGGAPPITGAAGNVSTRNGDGLRHLR